MQSPKDKMVAKNTTKRCLACCWCKIFLVAPTTGKKLFIKGRTTSTSCKKFFCETGTTGLPDTSSTCCSQQKNLIIRHCFDIFDCTCSFCIHIFQYFVESVDLPHRCSFSVSVSGHVMIETRFEPTMHMLIFDFVGFLLKTLEQCVAFLTVKYVSFLQYILSCPSVVLTTIVLSGYTIAAYISWNFRDAVFYSFSNTCTMFENNLALGIIFNYSSISIMMTLRYIIVNHSSNAYKLYLPKYNSPNLNGNIQFPIVWKNTTYHEIIFNRQKFRLIFNVLAVYCHLFFFVIMCTSEYTYLGMTSTVWLHFYVLKRYCIGTNFTSLIDLQRLYFKHGLNITICDKIKSNELRLNDYTVEQRKAFVNVCNNPPFNCVTKIEYLINWMNNTLYYKISWIVYTPNQQNIANYMFEILPMKILYLFFVELHLYKILLKVCNKIVVLDTIVYDTIHQTVLYLYENDRRYISKCNLKDLDIAAVKNKKDKRFWDKICACLFDNKTKHNIKRISIKFGYTLALWFVGQIFHPLCVIFLDFRAMEPLSINIIDITSSIWCGQTIWLLFLFNYFDFATFIVVIYQLFIFSLLSVSMGIEQAFHAFAVGFLGLEQQWVKDLRVMSHDDFIRATKRWDVLWAMCITFIQMLLIFFKQFGGLDTFCLSKKDIQRSKHSLLGNIVINYLCPGLKIPRIVPNVTKYMLFQHLDNACDLCNVVLSYCPEKKIDPK